MTNASVDPQYAFDLAMTQMSSFGYISLLLMIASAFLIIRSTGTNPESGAMNEAGANHELGEMDETRESNVCRFYCLIMAFMTSITTLTLALVLYITYPNLIETGAISQDLSKSNRNTAGDLIIWIFFMAYVFLFLAIKTFGHAMACDLVTRGRHKLGYSLSGLLVVLITFVTISITYFSTA